MMSEAVGMAVIPGVEGDMGIMADHAPTVSTLRPGLVSVHDDVNSAATRYIFVSGGVAEVTGQRCIILAEEAAELDEIDRAKADARLTEALAAVEAASSEGELARAEAGLSIAQAQVDVLTQHS